MAAGNPPIFIGKPMSAPLAGKFQDHYSLLGVDPRCGSEALEAAYTKLTEKYHPSNTQTGDEDKFESIKLAFEVLSDPLLRSEFDKIKGLDQDDANLTFAGLEFFEALGRQTGLRAALLCILYDRRRKKPSKPSLSVRHVENMIQSTNDELNFALFYLKQRGMAMSDDKSNLQITVDGMDFLERERPAPEKIMPFIKASALAAPSVPVPASAAASVPAQAAAPAAPGPAIAALAQAVASGAPAQPDAANGAESLVNVLNRAIARR
jgi:hypothetical protein